MTFKIYDCTFGVKKNGVEYEFDHVKELQVEDPVANRLTRGSNAKDTEGLVYTEGLRDPKTWTIPILAMTPEIKTMLDESFAKKERLDVYCIASDGSSKMLKRAILCKEPQQLVIDDSPDSMDVALEFQGYQSVENHKS